MRRRVPTRLVMAADYLADPLWTREPNGRTGAMVPLEQLPLSQATRARLRAWAARFDRLMDTGYEWPNAAEHRTWLADGRALHRIVCVELGAGYEVSFQP